MVANSIHPLTTFKVELAVQHLALHVLQHIKL